MAYLVIMAFYEVNSCEDISVYNKFWTSTEFWQDLAELGHQQHSWYEWHNLASRGSLFCFITITIYEVVESITTSPWIWHLNWVQILNDAALGACLSKYQYFKCWKLLCPFDMHSIAVSLKKESYIGEAMANMLAISIGVAIAWQL